jgi:hypothetical protein
LEKRENPLKEFLRRSYMNLKARRRGIVMRGFCRKRRVYKLSPHLYFSFAVLLLFPLLPLHTAQAAIINWSNSSGTGNGNPTLIGGNILQFSPQNFLAESINGKIAITSDRIQVALISIAITAAVQIKHKDFSVSNQDYSLFDYDWKKFTVSRVDYEINESEKII